MGGGNRGERFSKDMLRVTVVRRSIEGVDAQVDGSTTGLGRPVGLDGVVELGETGCAVDDRRSAQTILWDCARAWGWCEGRGGCARLVERDLWDWCWHFVLVVGVAVDEERCEKKNRG